MVMISRRRHKLQRLWHGRYASLPAGVPLAQHGLCPTNCQTPVSGPKTCSKPACDSVMQLPRTREARLMAYTAQASMLSCYLHAAVETFGAASTPAEGCATFSLDAVPSPSAAAGTISTRGDSTVSQAAQCLIDGPKRTHAIDAHLAVPDRRVRRRLEFIPLPAESAPLELDQVLSESADEAEELDDVSSKDTSESPLEAALRHRVCPKSGLPESNACHTPVKATTQGVMAPKPSSVTATYDASQDDTDACSSPTPAVCLQQLMPVNITLNSPCSTREFERSLEDQSTAMMNLHYYVDALCVNNAAKDLCISKLEAQLLLSEHQGKDMFSELLALREENHHMMMWNQQLTYQAQMLRPLQP